MWRISPHRYWLHWDQQEEPSANSGKCFLRSILHSLSGCYYQRARSIFESWGPSLFGIIGSHIMITSSRSLDASLDQAFENSRIPRFLRDSSDTFSWWKQQSRSMLCSKLSLTALEQTPDCQWLLPWTCRSHLVSFPKHQIRSASHHPASSESSRERQLVPNG